MDAVFSSGPRSDWLCCLWAFWSAVMEGTEAVGDVHAIPMQRVAAVANVAAVTPFPISNTTITLAKFNAAGTTTANNVALPDHCQIQGIAGAYTGTDKVSYGASFELRLPLNWNGRFMFQGGGGSEGSVPAATGVAGSISPTLAQGWAVVSQDGGHENSVLTAAGKSTLDFLSEPTAAAEWATGSIDKTTQTAKFLINTFYGRPPDRSYHVGCSTGGRQGMAFSQKFPSLFRRHRRRRPGLRSDGADAGRDECVAGDRRHRAQGCQRQCAVLPVVFRRRPGPVHQRDSRCLRRPGRGGGRHHRQSAGLFIRPGDLRVQDHRRAVAVHRRKDRDLPVCRSGRSHQEDQPWPADFGRTSGGRPQRHDGRRAIPTTAVSCPRPASRRATSAPQPLRRATSVWVRTRSATTSRRRFRTWCPTRPGTSTPTRRGSTRIIRFRQSPPICRRSRTGAARSSCITERAIRGRRCSTRSTTSTALRP